MKNRTNRLLIDIGAIKNNIKSLKALIGDSEFYAVIKADAYGLGAYEISQEIEDQVDGFCVSSIDEALELRRAGIKKEVLNLGFTQESELEEAVDNGVSIALYDYKLALLFNELLDSINGKLKVHIKLDTGHGRLGFRDIPSSIDEIEKISKLDNLEIAGVFSHFSTADEEDVNYTIFQKNTFDSMIARLEERSINLGKKHLSNDAGFIKHGIKYDLVRSGISMYGCYPSDVLAKEREVELSKVFSWYSKVSFVKEVEAGTSISYGRTFIAEKRMKIATVAVGYADGYRRSFSNKGYVLIKGQEAPVVGRITMDQTMVDVTDINGVTIGDKVTLIGEDEGREISVEMLADWDNTINYEIMTSISKRVDRIYYKIDKE